MSPDQTAHVDTFVLDRLPSKSEWPELLLDHPALRYPERLNAAVELLDRGVEQGFGDRPCMRLGDEVWTYDDMLVRSNQLAHVLVDDVGVVPGNRVLLRGPNAPWMVEAWFATLKVGAVAVVTMPLLRAVELQPSTRTGRRSLSTLAVGLNALGADLVLESADDLVTHRTKT